MRRLSLGHGKVVWRRSRVQGRAVIVAFASIGTEGSKRRAIGCRRTGNKRLLGISVERIWFGICASSSGSSRILAIVIVFAAHFGVFSNAPLPGLATDEGAAHGASDDATRDENDGCGQHNPPAPAQMGDEEQDIYKEGEKGDEQGRQEEDQQGQEVAGGMRRGMEVRGGG